MNLSLLYIALACPDIILENKTPIWSEKDQKTLIMAQERCKNTPNNECLKRFIKSEESVYVALCGPK